MCYLKAFNSRISVRRKCVGVKDVNYFVLFELIYYKFRLHCN